MAGEILKKRREELGKDLREIAHILKIRYDYLKAIEDDEFEKLPVEVYAKGYIRDYSRFLKIEPDIIINAYIQKTPPPVIEKPVPTVDIGKKKKIRIKYLSIAVISLVSLVIAITCILFLFPHKKPKVISPEKVIPKVQPLHEKVEKTGMPAKKEHVLEISAADTTWLLIKIDNTESKDMLLKEGESIKLSARQGFSLKIGNAGGIKIIFDGKDIGTLGDKGQVVNINLPEN